MTFYTDNPGLGIPSTLLSAESHVLRACDRSTRDHIACKAPQPRAFLGSCVWRQPLSLDRTKDVNDPSQPPLTVDLFVSHSAGSGSLHGLVRLYRGWQAYSRR